MRERENLPNGNRDYLNFFTSATQRIKKYLGPLIFGLMDIE